MYTSLIHSTSECSLSLASKYQLHAHVALTRMRSPELVLSWHQFSQMVQASSHLEMACDTTVVSLYMVSSSCTPFMASFCGSLASFCDTWQVLEVSYLQRWLDWVAFIIYYPSSRIPSHYLQSAHPHLQSQMDVHGMHGHTWDLSHMLGTVYLAFYSSVGFKYFLFV